MLRKILKKFLDIGNLDLTKKGLFLPFPPTKITAWFSKKAFMRNTDIMIKNWETLLILN